MASTKHIRPDDKKRGAAPAGGRAAAGLSGCRRCKEGGPAAGFGGAVGGGQCAGDGCGGQWSGGNSAVFNQLLTTFLVASMAFGASVFILCRNQSRNGLFGNLGRRGFEDGWPSPGGLMGRGILSGKGGGSGKRGGPSQDRGKSIAPHSLLPSTEQGVAENWRGGSSKPVAKMI